jgi:GAF domain-containing protein
MARNLTGFFARFPSRKNRAQLRLELEQSSELLKRAAKAADHEFAETTRAVAALPTDPTQRSEVILANMRKVLFAA